MTALYQQKFADANGVLGLGAMWFQYEDAELRSSGLTNYLGNPTSFSFLASSATVLDGSAVPSAYAGGGHYRIRACAIGKASYFTAGTRYWLRPLLTTLAGTVDLVGDAGVAAPTLIRLYGGPPEGALSSLNSTDLSAASASGMGPKTVRLQLADKLGHACNNSAAVLALSAHAGDPPYVRGFLRHLTLAFAVSC